MTTQVKHQEILEAHFLSATNLCTQPGDFVENVTQTQESTDRNPVLHNICQGAFLVLFSSVMNWLTPSPTPYRCVVAVSKAQKACVKQYSAPPRILIKATVHLTH